MHEKLDLGPNYLFHIHHHQMKSMPNEQKRAEWFLLKRYVKYYNLYLPAAQAAIKISPNAIEWEDAWLFARSVIH